jgi:hypothetical protein
MIHMQLLWVTHKINNKIKNNDKYNNINIIKKRNKKEVSRKNSKKA